MYTYEELLRLSGFKAREGEKQRFIEKWEELKCAKLSEGGKDERETVLRNDEISPSVKMSEVLKNAKAEKDGFIIVSEAYYEGEN